MICNMSRLFFSAVALCCGMMAFSSMAVKTYTLEEIESMKKAGKLTGDERFAIISATEAEVMIAPDAKTPSSKILTGKAAPTAIAETLAFDKVTPTRYLIMMAREYYGDGNFWVYIYQENKDKLGHPDHITPGTAVLVPSLAKYGVDPKNPADIEKAKKMGKEIYSRYGKNI